MNITLDKPETMDTGHQL